VVPETGKELEEITTFGGEGRGRRRTRRRGDNDDKNKAVFLLCVLGLAFYTETSHHKSTS
jgi:hypothetical protein